MANRVYMADPDEMNEPESFASNVPLTEVFGSHPKTKTLAALLSETTDPVTHFSVNEISRISGVDPESVEESISDLQSYGLVVETDDLDDEETYRLNEESSAIGDLRRLYNDLFEEIPGKETDS